VAGLQRVRRDFLDYDLPYTAAVAALLLFCEAAKQETATVELARRTIEEIEKVRRSTSPAA
jgi:hypothetical protein